MKKVILCALVLAVHGVLLNSALAQQVPRYLVTYARSQNVGPIRSATVVTVTNNQPTQSTSQLCTVKVEWFLSSGDSVCTLTALEISPGITRHFCSRNLPADITSCFPAATPDTCPALFGSQGTAVVSSDDTFECSLIAVDARVYYTTPGDAEVSAISNPKIVFAGEGNLGD
jgi:hypothetical protein